jgi:hypothetical protein
MTPEWERVTVELKKDLDPKHVKQRTQGRTELDYIEGWWAIAEANAIFGHGSWSKEVTLTQLGEPYERDKLDWKTKRPTGEKNWCVNYMGKVRITVDLGIGSTVVRDGCGYGSGIDADLGRAHESALKEAETDAMKRALTSFGWRFGLALYQKKEDGREHVSSVADGEEEGAGPPSPSNRGPVRLPDIPGDNIDEIPRNGVSAARSIDVWDILLDDLKKKKISADVTEWYEDKENQRRIRTMAPNLQWQFFIRMMQHGVDCCKYGIDVELFWKAHESRLDKLRKDRASYGSLEEYMMTKVKHLARDLTGGRDEDMSLEILTPLDAG